MYTNIINTKKLLLIFSILLICILLINEIYCNNKEDIIIDSHMTFAESIEGTKAPDSIIKNLTLLTVEYYSFDNKLHQGQIVIHKDLSNDIKEIFNFIKKIKFPIQEVIPIVRYNWNDSLSMAKNNTSAFNYRVVSGTNRLSKHSSGRAIDINPFQNPFLSKSKRITPIGAKYNKKAAGTLYSTHEIVTILKNKGWKWGGDWTSIKDWQHFEK